MDNNEIAEKIYYFSEDSVYPLLDKFNNKENNTSVDKAIVYCFIKAFHLYAVKLYIQDKKMKYDFDDLYQKYKEEIKSYYQKNNPDLDEKLLEQVLGFFDNSFALLETVGLSDINDSYEFRHYTINVFELLKMILGKKSQITIKANIFDDYIRTIIDDTEKTLNYINTQKR